MRAMTASPATWRMRWSAWPRRAARSWRSRADRGSDGRRIGGLLDRVRLALVAITDEMQRLGLQARRAAPVDERLRLAMRHPDLAGLHLADRREQIVPIGVIGNDERQLDALLARPGAD